MYGFGWLITLFQFLAAHMPGSRQFIADQPVEPLLDGWEGLSKGNENLIKNLGNRLKHLEGQNEKLEGRINGLEKEVADCNTHRRELQLSVEKLESNARKEKRYTHDRVHEFENFMDFLEYDLKSVGIEATAVAGILERMRQRRDSQYPHDHPSI